jgi:hypothetical protein
MKRAALIITMIAIVLAGYAQTVENIRVVQDGDNLKITYRIGASTDAQLFNVYLSCSMDGGSRFDPEAVIGDVGENIIGGKSFYTIVWDVFADVDEVVNPEFFVRVELVSDLSAPPVATPQTRQVTEEKPVEQPAEKEKTATTQESPVETSIDESASKKSKSFERNGFFSYSGMAGLGTPLGISFGSLNNFGYYVTPLRMGLLKIEYWDNFYETFDTDWDLHFMVSAGVTKHIVSAGFYRLHGYGGVGFHIRAENIVYDAAAYGHFMLETGVINVLGPVNLTLGLSYSIGYYYAANFVFGVGFVF